jgi:Mg-chelatase subunit ChlD
MKLKFALIVVMSCCFFPGVKGFVNAAGLDILLVLDNSGSMRKNDPHHLMRDVVTRFSTHLPAKTRLGIIIFGKGASLVLPLTAVNQEEFPTKLEESVGKIDYSSALTDTPAGVERAIYELRQNSLPNTKRVIVLFTDGIVDVGNPEKGMEREQWLRSNLTPNARQLGIRIFSVAFTEEADFQLMQLVAQGTDGEYFRILRDQDIEGVFRQLSAKLTPPAANLAPIKTAPPTNPQSSRTSLGIVIIAAGIILGLTAFFFARRRKKPLSSSPLSAKTIPNLVKKSAPIKTRIPVQLKTTPATVQENSFEPAPHIALKIPETLTAPVPSPSTSLSSSPSAVIFPSSTPAPQSSLMCSKHPLWKATETCPECQMRKCKNCMTERSGRSICTDCAKKLLNR